MFLISCIKNNAVDTVSYIGKCSCYLPPKLCYALLVPTSFNMHVKRAKCFMSFVRYPPSMCECLQSHTSTIKASTNFSAPSSRIRKKYAFLVFQPQLLALLCASRSRSAYSTQSFCFFKHRSAAVNTSTLLHTHMSVHKYYLFVLFALTFCMEVSFLFALL